VWWEERTAGEALSGNPELIDENWLDLRNIVT
jgi:hypothetical protein